MISGDAGVRSTAWEFFTDESNMLGGADKLLYGSARVRQIPRNNRPEAPPLLPRQAEAAGENATLQNMSLTIPPYFIRCN